ncbi:hypothetical protein [Allofournierella massiliensis]|uniref:hypothetical protein n=1 Tax=Allofournierella massiliensis TaxID=1650663 RepID=UPI001FA97A34|nr:hypothetical protein [Fournierella massiliensis]
MQLVYFGFSAAFPARQQNPLLGAFFLRLPVAQQSAALKISHSVHRLFSQSKNQAETRILRIPHDLVQEPSHNLGKQALVAHSWFLPAFESHLSCRLPAVLLFG